MKTQNEHTIDCDNRNEGFCICGAEPKKMLPQHTPTPWIVSATHSQNQIVQQFVKEGNAWQEIVTTKNPADAELIVRAVNSHDELCDYLRGAIAIASRYAAMDESEWLENAQKALAKAEGK